MPAKILTNFRSLFALHIDFIVYFTSLQFGILAEKHLIILFYFTKQFRNFADFRNSISIFELLHSFFTRVHSCILPLFSIPKFTKIFVISIVLFN